MEASEYAVWKERMLEALIKALEQQAEDEANYAADLLDTLERGR